MVYCDHGTHKYIMPYIDWENYLASSFFILCFRNFAELKLYQLELEETAETMSDSLICLSLSVSLCLSLISHYPVFRAFPQSDDKSACVSNEISSHLMIPVMIYQTVED